MNVQGEISVFGMPAFTIPSRHQLDAFDMKIKHIQSIMRCSTKVIVAAPYIVAQDVLNINNDF